jgi:hypothetical protein
LFLTKITEAWHVEVVRCTMVLLRCTIQVLNSEIKALAVANHELATQLWESRGFQPTCCSKTTIGFLQEWDTPKSPWWLIIIFPDLPCQNGPKKVYPTIWDKPNYDKKTELACTCVTCLIMPRSSAFQKRGSLIEKQNVNIVEPAAAWMSSSCDKACLSRAPGSKPDTWALIDGNVLWNIQGWFSRYELSGNGK